MKRSRASCRLIGCVAVVVLPAIAWAQSVSPGFGAAPQAMPQLRTTERREVDVDAIRAEPRFAAMPPAIATYALNLVVFAQSGWTGERAARVTADAAWILAQCGLRLRRASLHAVEVPQRFELLYTPASRVVAGRLGLAPPVVFFVRDTLNEPAFEAEAFGRGNTRARPELAGSVWLTAQARDPGVALAHELVHVLADSGDHSREPGNLMNAETKAGQHALDRRQCETILANGVRENWVIRLPQ